MADDARLTALEQQVRFIMQTIALTATQDGETSSRSLATLFEETRAHAPLGPQTLAQVAARSFAATDRGASPGPDGFPGSAPPATDDT